MRLKLILDLKSDNLPDFIDYHLKQSFFYSLLEGTQFKDLHDRDSYKFFCFSNIFQSKADSAHENQYTILFTSPMKNLVNVVEQQLCDLKKSKISMGDYDFVVVSVKRFSLELDSDSTLITGTPVVASIPSKDFEKYNIDSQRDYLYWNKEMPFDPFLDLLQKNSVRKYNIFHEENVEENLPLFSDYEYLGGALADYKDGKIAGSRWEFGVKERKQSLKVLDFCLQSGLGEKNSAGFGFLNLK